MPNKASAKKAIRRDEKRSQRNKVAKAELKSHRVKFRKALEDNALDKAQELAQVIAKMLDKLQSRGILKKNTASRYKSRMMKRLNRAKQA